MPNRTLAEAADALEGTAWPTPAAEREARAHLARVRAEETERFHRVLAASSKIDRERAEATWDELREIADGFELLVRAAGDPDQDARALFRIHDDLDRRRRVALTQLTQVKERHARTLANAQDPVAYGDALRKKWRLELPWPW